MAKNIRFTKGLILVFSLILYSFALEKTPVHLNQDELMFSLNAKSIAESGRDYYGNSMPFYFWHLGSLWATPVIVYLTSLFLKILPFSELTIRLSSVFIGTLSVYLLMVLTKMLFKSKKLTLIVGVLAITTPVLFIHSRLLLDSLYTVPFVLLWLVLLKTFVDKKKLIALFFSGLFLGIGIHSYHAGKIIMPIFFAVSVLYLIREKIKPSKIVVFATGFLLPIVLFIPWFIKHPDTILNQVSYIGGIDKSVEVSKGIWGVLNTKRIGNFLSNYISYFDTRILFVEGDRSLIHSTKLIGAFIFPVVFFLVFGILQILNKEKDRFSKLILFGLFVYPIAPAIVNDPQRIARGLIVIPFVLLISIYGIKFLYQSKERILKQLVLPLLILGIIQFGVFLNDYFGDYRVRSRAWFNNDIGGLYESVLKSTDSRNVENIYLDRTIFFAEDYFNFYQIKNEKDVGGITHLFDPTKKDFSIFSPGSIVAIKSGNVQRSKPEYIGEFQKIETIKELDGNETFYVYYREFE